MSEIEKAKETLEKAGYLIIKPNKWQMEQSKECERMAEQGEDMDCAECSCSCCLFQA